MGEIIIFVGNPFSFENKKYQVKKWTLPNFFPLQHIFFVQQFKNTPLKKKTIFERQNETKFIRMLAAQRMMYARGKQINRGIFWLNVIIPVFFICVVWLFLDKNPPLLPTLITGGFLFLITLFTRIKVSRLKRTAALIQERLDNDLLGITPNPKYDGQKITLEEIEKTAIRHEKPTKELQNWYYDNKKEDFKRAALDCQNQNMGWEGKQRRQYISFIGITGLFFIFGLFYFQIQYFPTKEIGLPFALFAGLLFYFCWVIIHGFWLNYKLKKKYFDVKLKALKLDENPEKFSDAQWKQFQREIQDFIYENRKSGGLIPDWFYSFFKKKIHPKVYRYDSEVGEILIETSEYAFFSKPKIEDGIKNFEEAFASVNHFSQSVIKEMEISNAKEVTLEMGLKITGGVEFAIAKAQKEGQVKVTVKWTKPEEK